VAIAQALVNNPAMILADEPTGNLDSHVGMEIMKIFQELNRLRQVTIVVVTHDPRIATYGQRRLSLHDG
jgi:putative ABC transport system ATP-binding protein